MKARTLAIILLRFAGFIFWWVGLWMITVSLLTGWGKFGWVYWQSFLNSQIIPAGLVALGGLLLWVFARPLGGWLSARLDD